MDQSDYASDVPPPFVKLKEDAIDKNLAESWDGWVVERSGDHKTDYLKGVEYADIAIRKVIATDNPAALTFPLFTLVSKIVAGEAGDGAIEKGFIDRVASLAADQRQKLDAN